MKVGLFIFLLLGTVALAQAPALVIKAQGKEFQFFLKDNLRVSKSCLNSDCLALKKVPFKTQKNNGPYVGQPAASLCLDHKGEYVVGKRESGDEDGICIFKDKSFILGWDYYKRNKGTP